jgi:hypothetical protein
MTDRDDEGQLLHLGAERGEARVKAAEEVEDCVALGGLVFSLSKLAELPEAAYESALGPEFVKAVFSGGKAQREILRGFQPDLHFVVDGLDHLGLPQSVMNKKAAPVGWCGKAGGEPAFGGRTCERSAASPAVESA